MVMSSNYNTRPRAAEVMVDGSRFQVVREREEVADLLRGERPLRDGKAARGRGARRR
jgi:diaminopimelate decarboxylase